MPMSAGEDKRRKILDTYIRNRNLLIDNNIIAGEKDFYLCPIDLKPHKDLNSVDELTLEDAPPKSLGGASHTLTCKSCNNTCGHKIDFHLVEWLKHLDSASFLPGTETPVKVKVGNEILQGELIIEEDGQMKMNHSKKNNNSAKLDKEMESLKVGDTFTINFLKTRVIPDNLDYALLKTAYILAFQKLGYSIITHSCFDIVREQLQNPNKRIYPEAFWGSFKQAPPGVYFVCNNGLESLLVIFELKTENSQRTFSVFLPLPINKIEKVVEEFNIGFNSGNIENLTLYPHEKINDEYLNDMKTINAMQNWIKERASTKN